jgi:hypothetical protein
MLQNNDVASMPRVVLVTSKRLIGWFVFASAVGGVVVWFYFANTQRNEFGTRNPAIHSSSQSLVSATSGRKITGNEGEAKTRENNASGFREIESEIIRNVLSKLRSELRSVEIANSTVAFSNETEKGATLILRLTPPTATQLGPINDWLARTQRQLGRGRDAEKEFRRQVDMVFSHYASYEEPYRILTLLLRNDEENGGEFFEFFAKTTSEGVPDANGQITMPKNRSIKFDHNYGAAKSWAAERYQHLFVAEREAPEKNNPPK